MRPEDALKLYETKINLHSFDEVESLISDDAVFWFSDGSYSGKDQIRKRDMDRARRSRR